VSIVFELLGAACVVGVLYSIEKNDSIADAFKYINFESTISIISGIFLSVFIAFTCGVIFQYLFRQLFTFEYTNRLKQFGALFAGFGITSIIYFLLMKGLKGTTLFSPNSITWVNNNITTLLIIIFIVIVLICFLLQHYAKVNPFK